MGTAWRADSGYHHNRGVSAADVIRFERDELGNDWPCLIPPALLSELEEYSANELIWVSRSRRIARLYGKPSQVTLCRDARVVYEDEDGTLVLNSKPKRD